MARWTRLSRRQFPVSVRSERSLVMNMPPNAAVDPVEPAAAAGRGEHWWPVALAILAVAGLHVVLPAQYRVNPRWAVPVVLLVLLAVLIIGDPGRIDRQKRWLRVVTGIVIAFITLANLFSAGRLIAEILSLSEELDPARTHLGQAGPALWCEGI